MKKITTSSVISAATKPESGVRAPRGFVDQRLRHAAAHRKPAPEACREIGSADREELLRRVEPIAVLGGEHPADRRGLHGGEHEARHRQRQQRVQIGPADQRQRRHRQTRWHLAEQRDAALIEAEHRAATMPPMTTNSATGRFFRTVLPSSSSIKRGEAQRQRRRVGVAQAAEEVAPCAPRNRRGCR